MQMARSWNSSIGFQRQFGSVDQIQPTTCSEGTHEKDTIDKRHLGWDPATGANLPYTNRATLPFPQYGVILDDSAHTHSSITAFSPHSPSA